MENTHGLLPDLIFFSGDLAFGNVKNENGWNLKDQYAEVSNLLDKVICAFSSEIPKSRDFIVPGNHDVDRKKVNNPFVLFHQVVFSRLISPCPKGILLSSVIYHIVVTFDV
ncbi:hypothetical protein QUF76_15365 [Desulfobacterales bacterium HSG16]|nr:hypothetical protein [Desulfobacterales bacterium HSG16]